MQRARANSFHAVSLSLLALCSACGKSPEAARKELAELKVPFTEDAFLESVQNSDAVVVDLFLTAGMNPNAADEQEKALNRALSKRNYEIAESLLKAGADPNVVEPLRDYELVNRKPIDHKRLNLLLRYGVDVNMVRYHEKFWMTSQPPLIQAIWASDRVAVEKLLAAGADVNLQVESIQRYTALMVAAGRGEATTVELLIRHGANLSLTNEKGKTALHLAKEKGHTEVVKLLEQAGALPTGDTTPSRTEIRSQQSSRSGEGHPSKRGDFAKATARLGHRKAP